MFSSVNKFYQLRHFVLPQLFQKPSLFIEEFFIPRFSVMIKVNKGDFYEKQIHDLNSILFVKNVFEDFCRLKFLRPL